MKKLSIVINSKNRQIQTQNLVKFIFNEKMVETEILVMDQSNDSTIDILKNKFPKEIAEDKLKIYSYYKVSPSKIRQEAIKLATGDYMLFIYSGDKLQRKFLYKISNISSAMKSDIIEFNVKHVGKVNIQNNLLDRLEANKVHNVQSNPSVLGLTSPFIYSKIYKKSFLRENIELFKLDSYYDSYYSYILISLAKSYYYVDTKGPIVKVQTITQNHDLLIKQWDMIINYFQNYTNWNITKKHLEYALVSYIIKTISPYLSSIIIDTAERIRKEKILIRQLVKKFPDWKSNQFVRTDKVIQKSTQIKSTVIFKQKEKKVKYWRGKKLTVSLDKDIDENKNN